MEDLEAIVATPQITQRYVAGKALEGAGLEEITAGIVDPVEQMNYVTGQAKQKSNSHISQGGSAALSWLIFISLIALAVLSSLFKLLF